MLIVEGTILPIVEETMLIIEGTILHSIMLNLGTFPPHHLTAVLAF